MRKAVVIGLGSMGRRRIRLMQAMPDAPEVIGVDISADRRSAAEREFGIATSPALEDLAVGGGLDCAFVCTSPLSHGEIAMRCLAAGMHVFTELNLHGDWYGAASAIAEERGLRLFLSSTFLYRKEIEYVVEAVGGRAVNYIYHSGQYLPDWHPWENFRDFFVADRRTNACREILAIELPWMAKAFGEIESLSVMKGRDSSLGLDFDDNYMIAFRHSGGSKGIFCQDVISRKAVRRLEVYSENLHVFWDGTPQSLMRYDLEGRELVHVPLYGEVSRQAGYGDSIVENAYADEIKAFFDFIDRGTSPRHTLDADGRVLSLIDEIEGVRHG